MNKWVDRIPQLAADKITARAAEKKINEAEKAAIRRARRDD